MTTFTIKIIALITMIIDHTGVLLYSLPGTGGIAYIMRLIGRIAFPLYAFLIAEGCRHTRSIKKYMLRLLIFAFISEIPFNLFIGNVGRYGMAEPVIFYKWHQNVFFTLFFGVLAISFYKYLKENKELSRAKSFVISLPFAVIIGILADYLKTDYGLKGVFIIYILYVFMSSEKIMRSLLFIVSVYIIYPFIGGYNYTSFAFAVSGVLPVFFYNGQKGPGLKWMFYIAYPLHLLLLSFLWIYVFRTM